MNVVVMIHFTFLGKWGVGWQSFGLAFCVISSLIVDFHGMTDRDCGAPNLLPSLSSSIGRLKPQVYIWRICTCFVTGIRLLAGACYFYWYLRVPIDRFSRLYKGIVGLTFYCYSIEIASLLGLSAISIKDKGSIHANFFKSYLGHGQMYMVLSIFVIFWMQRSGKLVPTRLEKRMLILRVVLLAINSYCAKHAYTYFYRFMTYCDAYGYTKFAICEYLAVTTNTINHSLAIIELKSYSFAVVPKKEITTGRFKNTEDVTRATT